VEDGHAHMNGIDLQQTLDDLGVQDNAIRAEAHAFTARTKEQQTLHLWLEIRKLRRSPWPHVVNGAYTTAAVIVGVLYAMGVRPI